MSANEEDETFVGSRLRIAESVSRNPEWLGIAGGPWPSLEGFRSGEPLRWLSPLEEAGWSELRDDMWSAAGLPEPSPSQDGWWPRRGPVWDGVATVPGSGGRSGVLLVEAKSHVDELSSSISSDVTPASRELIEQALDETRSYVGGSGDEWTQGFYQYANRLAWLYYLRAKRGLDAWLLWVYFTGDSFESKPPQQPTFPSDSAGWEPALNEMKGRLGLAPRHPLSAWSNEAFLPVRTS